MALEADLEGFTELAMGSQNAPQTQFNAMANPYQETKLGAEFYMHPEEDTKQSAELGRPFFVDKPYIRIVQPGNKNSEIRRPIRLGASPMHDNNRFAHQYSLFKQGVTQVNVGMPLTEWPVITGAQVKNLHFANVFTVEQLADMPDSNCQSFLGAITLKNKAKAWLSAAEGNSVNAQTQAALDASRAEVAALQEAVKEQGEIIRGIERDSKGRRAVK